MYRFTLFNLGFLGAFNKDELVRTIQHGCRDGYKLLRREFTFEYRRVFLILKALTFGLMFHRDEEDPEPDYKWSIAEYKTGLFSKTVNIQKLEQAINDGAQAGGELFHAMKYHSRFLLIFPRETYFFIFRRPLDEAGSEYVYNIQLTPYRLFSATMDPKLYERDLNEEGVGRQLKVTFRDEKKRFMGLANQTTAVVIWEEEQSSEW